MIKDLCATTAPRGVVYTQKSIRQQPRPKPQARAATLRYPAAHVPVNALTKAWAAGRSVPTHQGPTIAHLAQWARPRRAAAPAKKPLPDEHAVRMLPHFVEGPRRQGDITTVDPFDLYALPSRFARGLLDGKFARPARRQGMLWPEPHMLHKFDTLLRLYLAQLESKVLIYPAYALRSFHGYVNNLTWASVMEQASAMAIVPATVLGLRLDEAFHRRRATLEAALKCVQEQQGDQAEQTRRFVDYCCGTGPSTWQMAHAFPQAVGVGVDISAPMLAWAAACTHEPEALFADNPTHLEQALLYHEPRTFARRVSFHHANAEATAIAPDQIDLAALHFGAHELGREATQNIFADAYRVLKPGGWFYCLDISKDVLQSGPAKWAARHLGERVVPALAGLMAREPHLCEYLMTPHAELLAEVGFRNVRAPTDVPGNFLVMGQKPYATA